MSVPPEPPHKTEDDGASRPAGARAHLSTIAVGVAALVAAVAFLFLRKEVPPPPPPPVPLERPVETAEPAPVLPPAPSAGEGSGASASRFCVGVMGLYEAARTRLGCARTPNEGLAICMAPFERKPDCIDELEGFAACVKVQTDSSWACDEAGDVILRASACKVELTAFTSCMGL